MTPLYRFLESHVGPRLAPHLLAAIYAAILLAAVVLADYRVADQILYLDLPE
jgi:hypothetical protein